MTSAVAVIGLVWDNFDLQRPDLDIFFEITEGLDDLPQTRGADLFVPFLPGRLPSPAIADRRAVVATGWVTGRGSAPAVLYRTYVDTLKAKLNPLGPPRTLVAILADGSRRWVTAVPRNLLPGVGSDRDIRSFSIQWDALDPFWYGSNGYITLDSGLFMDGGYSMDEDAVITINPTTGTETFDFFTVGTADVTKVRVEIDGPTTGLVRVGSLNFDPFISFMRPAGLLAGETLVVDSGLRTVTLGGVNARADMVFTSGNEHGEYLRLCPGFNRIQILGQPAEVRLYFPATYL